MAVPFREVIFRNTAAIAVDLTVEAPIGTVVFGPMAVAGSSNRTVTPGVFDCPSVRLTASDPTHGAFHQTFEVAAAQGEQCFLERVDVRYGIGSFQGRVVALTREFG